MKSRSTLVFDWYLFFPLLAPLPPWSNEVFEANDMNEKLQRSVAAKRKLFFSPVKGMQWHSIDHKIGGIVCKPTTVFIYISNIWLTGTGTGVLLEKTSGCSDICSTSTLSHLKSPPKNKYSGSYAGKPLPFSWQLLLIHVGSWTQKINLTVLTSFLCEVLKFFFLLVIS